MTTRRHFIKASALAAGGCAVFPAYLASGARPSGEGKFKPDWESLEQYECPQWFRDAKLGIFSAWGPQSVPEHGDWYARFMYQNAGARTAWQARNIPATYQYHVENYGHPSEFGFKDLIPLFTASKFEPDALLDLYSRAGAEYLVALANHHENYDLWDSKYQPWNSVNTGPKKDIMAMWEKATRSRGMHFGVSTHSAPAWWWFEVSRGSDPDGPLKGVPYDGNLTKEDGKGKWWEGLDPHDLYCRPHEPGEPEDEAYLENYYNRMMDLLDSYHPDLLYFDGALPFGDLGMKLAANFYNSNTRWNNGSLEAVLNLKTVPEGRRDCVAFNIERGVAGGLEPHPWQTDSCIGSFYYDKRTEYKTPEQVISMLVDIVSKNGNLLLSIPQREDGSLDAKELAILEEMAAWMSVNKEAIFGTRPWSKFGEGPTMVIGGTKNESANWATIPTLEKGGSKNELTNLEGPTRVKGGSKSEGGFTAEDIRFTTKNDSLYAILLGWPKQESVITSLPVSNKLWFGKIRKVELLGSKQVVSWKQDEKGLRVEMPKEKPCDYAYVLKISG